MIKLAVIGAGKFGTNILNAFSQLEKQGLCQLTAICDIDKKLLETQALKYGAEGYTDYREMLEREDDLTGVAIATPDPFHREPALYAASLGKHLFVEKPMDITIEGCKEMIDACAKNNVLLQVDFHKRFDPFHISVQQDVQQGKIGTVEYGYVHMEDKIVVPRDWFPGWAPKSSPAWFLGIHFFDLTRWILGSNGKKVYASGKKLKLKELGVDTYDHISAMIEFENRAVVTFDVSWILPEDFEAIVNQGIRLVGEDGIIECDSQDRGIRVFYKGKGGMTYNPVFLNERTGPGGSARLSGYGIESIADFVYNIEHILKGGSIEDISRGIAGTGDDGLQATRMAVAVHKSLETGNIVDV